MTSNGHSKMIEYLRKIAKRPGMYAPSSDNEFGAFIAGILSWHKETTGFDDEIMYGVVRVASSSGREVHWTARIVDLLEERSQEEVLVAIADAFQSIEMQKLNPKNRTGP